MSLELYRNGSIYSPADPFATAMLVEGGTVAWIGSESAAGSLLDARMAEIDLQGALVTPAFVDSHVHLGSLGSKLNGLDLGGARSVDALLSLVSAAAADTTGILIGSGWDETRFASGQLPTAEQLQKAAPDREVYMARIDVHSALVSPALAHRIGLREGPEYTGALVRGNAHERVRDAVFVYDPDTNAKNRELALAHMASTGHGTVVEMAAEHIGGREDLEGILGRDEAAKAMSPEVFAYWGELVSTREVGS